jgi:hypothetical protein
VAILKYNQSTGSNTAASGSNTPATAVTGINGSLVTTTLTLNETRDFTGALDNDEDVVWINTTTTNRHLYRITAFTGGVATCTALVLAESGPTQSSLSWAVGGKRLSLDNDTGRPDIEDYLAGWIMELEGTAVTYSPAAASLPMLPTGGSLARGPVVIRGAAGATVTITAGTSTLDLFEPAASALVDFMNLTLTNTGTGTTANILAITSATQSLMLIDVAMSSYAPCILLDSGPTRVVAVNCSFKSTNAAGVSWVSGVGVSHWIGCAFYECATDGIELISTSTHDGACFRSCIFRDNGADGLSITPVANLAMVVVRNCVFHDNVGDGIEFGTLELSDGSFTITNCIFTENGGYGIAGSSDTTIASDMLIYADYNAFRNNTSGARQYLTAGAHDVTLTDNPYANEANNDFRMNGETGGGAACVDAGLGRDS